MEALQGQLRASLGEEEERAFVAEWTSWRDAHMEEADRITLGDA